MYQTVSKSDFRDAFQKMGRGDNFTYDGLSALYDFVEEMETQENEIGSELDVIALCCGFCEYGNIREFQQDYSDDYTTIEEIENATTVIRIDDDAFIIQSF